MISGDQFRAKITKVLTDVAATSRTVKFRSVTQTGGNPLLGIGGTVTTVDTVVVPQPAVSMLKMEQIAGASNLLLPGDWRFIFDASVTEDTLRSQQLVYGDEVLHIVQIEPYAFKGAPVGWSVIARTVTTRT